MRSMKGHPELIPRTREEHE
jgi:hypothetical protein